MSPNTNLLSTLTEVAKSINSESDELNKIIDQFEAELAKARIGLTVWVSLAFTAPINDDAFSSSEQMYDLGYAKIKGNWRVGVRACHHPNIPPGGGGFVTSKNWVSSAADGEILRDQPRMIRVNAIPHLDKLTKALIEKATEFQKTLKDARSKA